MTNKEKVILKLKELSLNIDGSKEYGIDALTISDILGLQRNLVSHILNELSREDEAIKINKRPVYFISKDVYEENKGSFKLVSEYIKENSFSAITNDSDSFKEIIGTGGSLKDVVQQCKSAVSYPPNGLPFLLLGSSGVGKSFLAQKVYDYAKNSNYIKQDAPFEVFNCAEYANNPELFSAILFGAAKGAYTGADNDRIGLIEKANGGYLFLDEIHRLPPEGQEKLFLFLDKGIFRRLGETEKKRQASVRMIFATTENPENKFLQTFLRRIPLIVKIPSFKERPLKEKLELINTFYKREALNIKKDIIVNNQVVNILINANTYGNLGKLINAIKLSCANGLNSQNEKKSKGLKIKINNLPKDIIEQDDELLINELNIKDMYISCLEENDINYLSASSDKAFELTKQIVDITRDLGREVIHSEQFFAEGVKIFNELIDYIVFSEKYKSSRSVIFKAIEKTVENSLSFMNLNYGIDYLANSSELISYLITHFMESNIYYDDDEISLIANEMTKRFPKEYKLALKLVEDVEKNLDLEIDKIAELYILIYIKSLNKSAQSNINAVIIAHGYSTASSIAGVANRLFGKYIFEPFDMPIESSPLDISAKLLEYIKTIDTSKGLLILVDMGSLETIYILLEKEIYGDIAIIDNASTKLALDVGSRILQLQPLKQIAEETAAKNVSTFNYIESTKKKTDVIITTCITGIGTASKIKDLLNSCFNEEEIKIVAYDYESLKSNGREDFIFKQYNVKVIIGTNNPDIEDVPFVSLENLIMKKADSVLTSALKGIVDKNIIEKINKEAVKLFTLENVLNYLTILNPDKIVDQVEDALTALERSLGFKLENDLKIGLYIHISCMIERLVIKDPIMSYRDSEEFEKCHVHFIKLTKKAFSVIEQFYRVEIPISEIGFIYDSIKNKIKSFDM
ncbi:sigma 54-interacting transcriptional regulator [Clostridium folliculivorans]|uniref:sigma 54-interacting transcriptional regulator n=1 Tax=Clostridium folliculivorans TaxID=2886038 RepID=UPI0021C2C329|nr:sigma 54-interacting transcriptional regulator [Clostridium folliculivorans]GKU31605.1 transcriptional antiterminator [Clostridium folliculivorans]